MEELKISISISPSASEELLFAVYEESNHTFSFMKQIFTSVFFYFHSLF